MYNFFLKTVKNNKNEKNLYIYTAILHKKKDVVTLVYANAHTYTYKVHTIFACYHIIHCKQAHKKKRRKVSKMLLLLYYYCSNL